MGARGTNKQLQGGEQEVEADNRDLQGEQQGRVPGGGEPPIPKEINRIKKSVKAVASQNPGIPNPAAAGEVPEKGSPAVQEEKRVQGQAAPKTAATKPRIYQSLKTGNQK